jgi:acetylornithine deacetylase
VGSVRQVMQRFRDAVAAANRRDRFLRCDPVSVAFTHHDDSVRQDPGIAVARAMGDTLARRGAGGPDRHGPFCCDMRHLVNQGGIPAIVFGPRTIAQAHKPDEHIPFGEFLAAIGHLIAFIAGWCNQDAPVRQQAG